MKTTKKYIDMKKEKTASSEDKIRTEQLCVQRIKSNTASNHKKSTSMEKLELTQEEIGLIKLALQDHVDTLNHRFSDLDESKYTHPAKKYDALLEKINSLLSNTMIYYEIKHGSATIPDQNRQYRFSTEKEATLAAFDFKKDPRSHNAYMEDISVEYWKKQNFEIVKKTVITEILNTI